MPYRTTHSTLFWCVCCLRENRIGLCKHAEKKVKYTGCCGGPVCCGNFPRPFCQFCQRPTTVEIERKTGFPFAVALGLTWEDWFFRVTEYATLAYRPHFREFVKSSQSPLQWHDHLRLRELFNEYIFLRPASLQLVSVFRMRMRLDQSNASVFGSACHRFTQMLALCRTNGVRVIHPRKIHAHFGIVALCVVKISTEHIKYSSQDEVDSKTYWRTMIPWIIRWIARHPK
jgi:hypothetical protein